MNKRAQFFLLAAVIIAAVIISFGVTTNRAIVSNEPESFYDFSYDVQREAGAVLDYEVYSGFAGDDNLTDFVDLLAEDIRDNVPGADFLFVYGSNEGMTLKNYGAEDAQVGGELVPGSGISAISEVCFGEGLCQEIEVEVGEYDEGYGYWHFDEADLAGEEELSVEVSGHEFNFPISEHRQVIFIMQKDVGDESFITTG